VCVCVCVCLVADDVRWIADRTVGVVSARRRHRCRGALRRPSSAGDGAPTDPLAARAVVSQPMDKGGRSPGAPKALGAPEQCRKKSTWMYHVIHVTFHSIKAHVIYRYLPNNGHCDLSTSKSI